MAESPLNLAQQQAITHGDGPLLIIAGAGTGKTTVIVNRITHLIVEKKVSPFSILSLTFTEKAAAEMEERLDVALPLGLTGTWIETFHGFCDRVLRNEAFHIGLSNDYTLLTSAQLVLFLRKNIFKLELDYFRPLGNPNKFLQALLQHFSRLKDEDIQPIQYIEWVKSQISMINSQNEERTEELQKYQELAHAYKIFEELKIQEGVMDFSDLISNTLLLFEKRKHILKQYQNQFAYLLIDEFQDTNFAQNKLAILLAGEKQNITVVGDDDQAIYKWRGASLSNMLQFKKHFPTSTIVTLIQNYRSSQTILDGAYNMIQYNNPDRLEVKEQIDKKLIASQKNSGDPIRVIVEDSADNEADTVARTITELMKKEKYGYKDFAILVRANDHATAFTRSLERAKIPFQFLGPGQLFHQEEIKDIIAYLKVLYNYEDAQALYRVLTMPIFSIESATVATLLNTAKRRNKLLFDVCTEEDILISTEEKEKVTKVITLIKKHLSRIPHEPAGQILYSFLQESGLIQSLIDPKTPLDENRAIHISRFFDKIKMFETEAQSNSIFAIVDWIDISMQMGESPLTTSTDWGELDAVNILTIHASKGLEFPVVFLVNLVKDRFPSRQRGEPIPIPEDLTQEILPVGDVHLQEERRLAYVGITRAKEKLYLTSAKFYGERKRERKLSPFIQEVLGQEEIEKILLSKNKKNPQLSIFEMLPEEKVIPTFSIVKSPHIISYLSYSQMQTFEMCPLHYKLKYILKIPTPQTSSQTFGTTLHAVLRDFYQQQILENHIKIDDIDKLLKKNWNPEGYGSREHEQHAYKRAIQVLKDFLTVDFKPDSLPVTLEQPFEFYINRIRIGGRIDRIDDLGDGRMEIIDYKTGSNVPEEKDLVKNLQLTTYALASKELNKNLFQQKFTDVSLALFYIEKNIKLTTTRTFEELEQGKETFIKKAEEISTSDFLCNKSLFCQNCEYKMICNVKT